MNIVEHQLIIPAERTDSRLDQVLSYLLPQYSRNQLKNWILAGYVKLNGQLCQRPKEKVKAGQTIEMTASLETKKGDEAENIPLDIIYQDEALIIINKPADLTVHPGAGQPNHTLMNGLLHAFPELRSLPRAGIVHRLDKDTSGLLVVAHNLETHHTLINAMQNREVKREYEAIVHGQMISGGSINAPIGRDPLVRTRFKVTPGGKPAITHYRILKRFNYHTHILVTLETGRTHQIRVHLQSIRHPLVGDPHYGRKNKISPQLVSEQSYQQLYSFKRQALHACRLSLHHPFSGKLMSWEAPLPADMQSLLDNL